MDALTIMQAIILGVVEGITEYLPISSTGHLIITASLLGLDAPPERKAAVDAFMIVIQGGAILAVLGLYWKRVVQMIRGIAGRDPAGRRLAMNLVIAFLPAAVLGVLLDETIERLLFHPVPVIAALALGGVAMIVISRWQRHHYREPTPDDAGEESEQADGEQTYITIEELAWSQALFIGFLQCVAMWPGTSRSMMTIVGGMLVGMRPKHAAEFSFLLGLPTLGGACVYKVSKDLTSDGPSMFETLGVAPLLIGIAVAFVSAMLAVRWLVTFLTKHGLAAFGWYRIVLSVILGLMLWRGLIEIGQ